MTQRLQVRSQLPHIEKGGILDDCGLASAACAVGWASRYALSPSAADGIAAGKVAIGRADRDGVSEGTTLAQLIKVAQHLGGRARWARDWMDVVAAAAKGAAIIINVDAPKHYTAAMLAANAFARKRKGKEVYGHMICAGWTDDGWQIADPTQTGKGKERYGAPVAAVDLWDIASSKGDAPHSRVIIVSYSQTK